MSTERDETTPVPAQPGGTPGDQPTTPIPRPGTGRTEEPTLVFDTFAPEPDPRATRPIDATSGPDATRPLPATQDAADRTGGHTTPRTSAFAAAGVGAGAPGGSGAAASPIGAGASGTTGTGPSPVGAGVPGPGDAGTSPVAGPDPAPAEDPSLTDPGISRQLRVGTVVWGLVLAIIGAGIVAVAAGATFDLELALIGLLALAGLALVVGSVVTASRRRR